MELVYGDAAKTELPDNSASVVSLCLVVHELSRDARKEVRRRGACVRFPNFFFRNPASVLSRFCAFRGPWTLASTF